MPHANKEIDIAVKLHASKFHRKVEPFCEVTMEHRRAPEGAIGVSRSSV